MEEREIDGTAVEFIERKRGKICTRVTSFLIDDHDASIVLVEKNGKIFAYHEDLTSPNDSGRLL